MLFMLSEHRDEPEVRAFFEKAIGSSVISDKINMDKSGANKAGIEAINLRQVKYLNNIIVHIPTHRDH